MRHLLVPETSALALVVRAVVVYGFLLLALRIAGRRELAQMTSFDLVLLLVISNAVQNAINAGDNSLTGGLVSAAVLLLLNWFIGWATYRGRWAERLCPGLLFRFESVGHRLLCTRRQERFTLSELLSAKSK